MTCMEVMSTENQSNAADGSEQYPTVRKNSRRRDCGIGKA